MAGKCRATPEQLAALVLLCRYGSHAALGPREAEKVLAPFGLPVVMGKTRANVDPKGLLNPNLKRGQVVECIGGWVAAARIGSAVGAQWEGAFGRGTEFWRAIEAIKVTLAIGPRKWKALFREVD